MTRLRQAAGKTLRLSEPRASDFDDSSTLIFSSPGSEPRARAPIWSVLQAQAASRCVEVTGSTAATVTIQRSSGTTETVPLNDDAALKTVLGSDAGVYIDISGLPHHVWAALLRVALQHVANVKAVYVEPGEYKKHPNPTSKTEYDLSEGFGGLEPLPGFAKLTGPKDEKDAIFVALLGFEGKRASHLASNLDPVPEAYAIVGVPGFRLEHPQIAHSSNEHFLTEFRAQGNVRYAAASCPFEAYDTLSGLRRDSGNKYMYVAPVGTKPHALGAVCYALKHRSDSELMYDHPKKKAGRTVGIGLFHIYTLKPSYVAP